MSQRFFHEDEYCQQEYLPLRAWGYCAAELQKIAKCAKAHEAPVGWTELYLRDDGPVLLREAGLDVDQVRAAVSPLLPQIQEVSTGYSTHREACPSVSAFGESTGPALFVEAEAGGRVTALWVDGWEVAASDVERYAMAFSGLPAASDLLFVDWSWGRLLRAHDRAEWLRYLGERAARAEEIARFLKTGRTTMQ